MPCGWLISRALRIFSAIAAIAVLSIGTAIAAESTGALPNKPVVTSKKAAAVKRDRKSRELSPSALGMENDKSHGFEPGDKADLKRPDEFKFGDNTLHLDANKNDPTPPVGLEQNGQAVLNKAPTEPALQPSYFGLRLTTPIR
jgi:hypothetical protein